jgi:drug/metabolite transporter (DMT)-like permease
MILAALAIGAFGLYLLVRGDGQARILGIILILVGGLLGFLFWVAVAVERPDTAQPARIVESSHG